jgi:hypothetical protein
MRDVRLASLIFLVALDILVAFLFLLELLNLSSLSAELSTLSINLALLIRGSMFQALDLIPNQTASEGAHRSANRRPSPWRANTRADDGATRRAYAAA